MRRKLNVACFLFFILSLTCFAKEKYAVIIGINDYKNPRIRDLNYSEPDAIYLKDVLIKYARYKLENIHMLLGRDATYLNIKEKIYWLGDQASLDDDVLFYFSGHGTRVEDKDNNEEDGMDEAFCPFETNISRPSSVILDDDIGHWFKRINADQVLVILDCCHSGGAAGRSLEDDGARGLDMTRQSHSRSMIDTNDDPYSRDLSLDNKFVLTASDADEKSYENPDLGHGVFTYYIGEAIRGNADKNGNNEVTGQELFDYTKEKTLDFAKTINQTQTPMCFGSMSEAIVCEISQQMCELKYYDPDLNLVYLGIKGDVVKVGDEIVVKKNMQSYARDIEIADMRVFKIKVTKTAVDYVQGNIVKTYFNNVKIDPNKYQDYYGELLQKGNLNIITKPWSTVFLDGKEVGVTPLMLKDIPSGEYKIEYHISEMGYPKVVTKSISVEGNDKLRIIESFEKSE